MEEHTEAEINAEIYDRTKNNVVLYASAGHAAINRRLRDLLEEWDIERVLEANAASFSLICLVLGAFLDRRWLVFPAAVAGLLLQHAIQGWCPPVPVFRRMGITKFSRNVMPSRHCGEIIGIFRNERTNTMARTPRK